MARGQTTRPTKGTIMAYKAIGGNMPTELPFMLNPTTIKERREAVYNFSEAQGQILPMAQYGRVGNTEISFELFMFNHGGLKDQMKQLRALTLPKAITNLQYYSQAQPNLYTLDLVGYGIFVGVVNSVNITTEQYHKRTLEPTRLRADIVFTQVSVGTLDDVSYLTS